MLKQAMKTICIAAAGMALLTMTVSPRAMTGESLSAGDDHRPQPTQGNDIVVAAAAGRPALAPTNPSADAPATPVAITIAPARVAFSFTPGGAWLGFGPADGSALIGEGGFVVLASGKDGRHASVLDTRAGTGVVAKTEGQVRSHEGAEGGQRYPSSRPDDDDDGMIDEDRLDGLDNDGDGRVDEDFAAIGDEMVVTVYEVTPDADDENAPRMEVHQESYAWTLSHIDGMIVTRLTVRNTGLLPLADVRVGAVFEKPEGFVVETQDLGGDGAAAFDDPLVAKGMLLRRGEDAVAALFFSPPGRDRDQASWLTGVAPAGRELAGLIEASNRADAIRRPGAGHRGQGQRPGGGHGDDMAGADRPPSPREFAYGVSPDLGSLAPGEQISVYVALVYPPSTTRARRAINDAWRTVIGDGSNRLIPPPVSITRRVIWGTYELRVPDYAAAGVTVRLANPRAEGVDPTDIGYINGIDMRSSTPSELPDGDAQLVITGNVPGGFAENGQVVLHGRMRDGEWFDAVLQPAGGIGNGRLMSAAQFFGQPGKLDESLLGGSPNPFRETTTIHFEVPARLTDENGNEYAFAGGIDTSVKVYSVTGRLVSTLVETPHSPGRYETQWSARDEAGNAVASGVYYVKLQIGERFVTKRLIQLK